MFKSDMCHSLEVAVVQFYCLIEFKILALLCVNLRVCNKSWDSGTVNHKTEYRNCSHGFWCITDVNGSYVSDVCM
jgi:hypothetical protein